MSRKIIKTIGTDGRRMGNFYVNCVQCGNKIKVRYFQTSGKHKRKFCNNLCLGEYLRPIFQKTRLGSNNPAFGKRAWNYKDGMSRHRTSKNKFDYWVWRRKVILRDDQTCQNCKIKLKRKDCIVHHIKSWSEFPELRYIVSNGITYCRPCHNKIDKFIKDKHFK